MAQIRIEMDRGAGWEMRSSGDVSGDDAEVLKMALAELPRYAVQYPHRAWVNGVMVGECQPARRGRQKC